jgi:hypothetical protein
MFILPKIDQEELVPLEERLHIFLLPPGSGINYDSSTKFFRSNDPEYLIREVTKALDSYTWKGHVIEEFELHEFHAGLIPENHKWKEFTETGQLKTTSEKARS